MKISIITPTYNRAKLLERCYRSLCIQCFDEMEWIVIDDGSTDDTEQVVSSFLLEQKISIQYIYQENAGKHIAHNTGVEAASGELTVCLDSDDFFPQNALKWVWDLWENISNQNFIGIIGKRGSMSGEPLCSDFPKHISSVNMYDLNNLYQFSGDTVLFFRTDVLKKEKFPQFAGEKFLAETALYYELDTWGEMYIANRILYIGEYQVDGLTSKYHRLLRNNPIGAAYAYYITYNRARGLKEKLKYCILTNAYWVEECEKYFYVNRLFRLLKPVSRMYRRLKLEKI